MRWYLERLAEADPGVASRNNRLPLPEKPFDVGTDDWCDLILKSTNKRVDKFHATFVFLGNRHYVRDVFSVHGTFVNTYRTETNENCRLISGDIIGFGRGSDKCDHGKGCFCYRVVKDELDELYQINIEKEFASALSRELMIQEWNKINENSERQQRIDELANGEFEKELIAKVTPEDLISEGHPSREFIRVGSSFCDFDADSLDKPAALKRLNTKDSLLLHKYLKAYLQDASEEEERQEGIGGDNLQKTLEYMLLLASVHRDELIVDCCADLLIEFNHLWQMSPTITVSLFRNWGADINELVTSPREGPTPSSISRNNADTGTVSDSNVKAVLRVFLAQFELQKKRKKSKFGDCREFLFGALTLLSLDHKFIFCLSELVPCVWALLDVINETEECSWVVEYSKKLVALVTDDLNLTWIVRLVLNGCLPADRFRVAVSNAAIQRVLGRPNGEINYDYDEPCRKLRKFVRSTTLTALRKPPQMYCLLNLIDTIIREDESNEVMQKFHNWLERSDGKVGTNAHLNALFAFLLVLWDVDNHC